MPAMVHPYGFVVPGRLGQVRSTNYCFGNAMLFESVLHMHRTANHKSCFLELLIFSAALLLFERSAEATEINLIGPAGSARFGDQTHLLPNGNIVVVDPAYTNAGVLRVGAVYLYDRDNAQLISTLYGSSSNDAVGSGGINILPNGNFVVSSSSWKNGTNSYGGAVTWCSAVTGRNGPVTTNNSLVGFAMSGDGTGGRVTVLSNGNYVVSGQSWRNGTNTYAGAVTFCNGATGTVGTVSSAISLVGSKPNDRIGNVTALPSGNYVVNSSSWGGGRGVVTFCNGVTGRSGEVSALNSAVGESSLDGLGYFPGVVLSNGNCVVNSPYSGGDRGAVTWINGITGDIVTLRGWGTSDYFGSHGIVPLANGNYVLRSPYRHNKQGEVTLINGATGQIISSIVGARTNNFVSLGGVIALANGNYLIQSPDWSDVSSPADAGAVTWCSGTSGLSGLVSSSNSLIGNAGDRLGSSVSLLPNGHYVVFSWNGGKGAVTWGSGVSGRTGTISGSNSLVGSSTNDFVGSGGLTALSNGHYVVSSHNWNATGTTVGAVTWCNGTFGRSGTVSSANSLVGSSAGDRVGSGGITALTNGNYVVASPLWNNGSTVDVGAATWCNGVTGRVGTISTSNSLTGSSSNDRASAFTDNEIRGSFVFPVMRSGIIALSNGNYAVVSPHWKNGTGTNAGAVTLGDGVIGVTGNISITNSLVGSINDGLGSYSYRTVVFLNTWTSVPRTVLTTIATEIGDYMVVSPNFNRGTLTNVGSAVMCSGNTAVTGTVFTAGGLMGTSNYEMLGAGGISALQFGNCSIRTPYWNQGNLTNAGAITLCLASRPLPTVVSAANSATGNAMDGGLSMTLKYDSARERMIVGFPSENRVVLFFIRSPQTITFRSIPNQTFPSTMPLNASSSSGLNIRFQLISGPAAINGNELSLTNAGTVTVAAFQDGDASIARAQPITNKFNVTAAITTNTGTPIWWLMQYGFTNNFEEAALLDLDGDGAPNWHEYGAGTVPTNTKSVLQITLRSMTTNQAGSMTQVWQFRRVAGRFYDIHQSTNLSSGGWMAHSGNLSGTNDFAWTNIIIKTSQLRVYRVRARIP